MKVPIQESSYHSKTQESEGVNVLRHKSSGSAGKLLENAQMGQNLRHKSSGSVGKLLENTQIGTGVHPSDHDNTMTFSKSAKHHSSEFFVYKIIDLGTAIGVMDIGGESIQQATASLMTFSTLEFAG